MDVQSVQIACVLSILSCGNELYQSCYWTVGHSLAETTVFMGVISNVFTLHTHLVCLDIRVVRVATNLL